MEFNCVLVKNRKKLDRYLKSEGIKNKFIIDVNKIVLEEEEIESFDESKDYLKIVIVQKIYSCLEKKKNIFYIPSLENNFTIEKLLKMKDLINGVKFNLIFFCDGFNDREIFKDILENVSFFDGTKIIND